MILILKCPMADAMGHFLRKGSLHVRLPFRFFMNYLQMISQGTLKILATFRMVSM